VAFWLALLVYLGAVLGGIAYVVLRGLALWRTLKRTGGTFGDETAHIADATEHIQVHMDRMNASVARLGETSRRLSASRQRLDVQLQAVREARETLRRLLWFIPGA
jgi:hypothetical protein